MSSLADKVTFLDSEAPQDKEIYFQSKKYTYITDSSSNAGSFNGQIQFDLNTLSSQNQWTDLSEAVIEFPIKLSINNKSGTIANWTHRITEASIKNGFHQFVDSIQVVIGGNTVQSSQIFTNIDANYKILTTWSKDTLAKYGDSLGLCLDDWNVAQDTGVTVTSSLDNANVVTDVGGFNMAGVSNPGFKGRVQMQNNAADYSASTTACLGRSILSTNQARLAKSNVQIGSSITLNDDVFVMYLLGTVRLKDISDFCAKMPLSKGLKGYIYVNYNSASCDFTGSGSTANKLATLTNSTPYGRCNPGMLNISSTGLSCTTTVTGTLNFKVEVSSVKSATLTTADTILSTARLTAPYYVANPAVDRMLTMTKTFRYNERFVTQFSVDKSGTYNGTITPGITNPKRIILYPYITGAGDSGNSGFVTNPLINPLDSCPSTTSPFAALKELQVYCGNVPMFQSPITMDYDTFLNEVATQGEDGGLNNQVNSGLISQRQWNQLYRLYTCDLSRRMDSEDGASKSIQVSLTNATVCPITVIAIVWYEREVVFNTASGQVDQVR